MDDLKLKRQETAFMFDVDGVFTNPLTKKINENVLKFVKEQLDLKVPLCFFTGRTFKWLERKFLNDLINKLDNKNLLDFIFISYEHGCIFAEYVDGIKIKKIKNEFKVPDFIRERVKEIIKNYPGIFFDDEKEIVLAVEMEGGKDKQKNNKEQRFLKEIEEKFRELIINETNFKVFSTQISVEMQNIKSSKKLASIDFLNFLNKKKFIPKQFFLFGDNPTDLEAADELYSKGKNVIFGFVGERKIPDKPYQVIKSKELYDKGVVEILSLLSVAPE